MLVAPEQSAAQQKEQGQDREFGAADALFAAVAVVPGEDQHDGQADQQRERGKLLDLFRPVEGVGGVGEALQQPQAPAA